MPAPTVRWPYLPDIFVTNVSHIFARASSLTFPDVFSNAFNSSTDRRVAEWVLRDQHINHPRNTADVIGYYFEDQPLWNVSMARYASGLQQQQPGDWTEGTRSLPNGSAGKHAYVAWLQARYSAPGAGGLAGARVVYNMPASIQDWGSVYTYNFNPRLNLSSADVEADDNEFLGAVADRLFAVGAGAVRRHDPGALVFGQRFLSNDAPPAVLAAAGKHFDAISVQPAHFSFGDDSQAEASVAAMLQMSALAGGKPIFIADQATHFPEPNAGNGTLQPTCGTAYGKGHSCVATEAAAAAAYAEYLTLVRSRSEFIGYVNNTAVETHCTPHPVVRAHVCICLRACVRVVFRGEIEDPDKVLCTASVVLSGRL